MKKVWQVVIVDIHPTSMLGTKLILEEQQDLTVRGMTSTGTEGLELVSAHKPDLILMDYRLPEGQADQYIAQIKGLSNETHIIILTDEDNVKLFRYLMSLGASGMLSKQASPSQLIHLISGLREGYVSIPMSWLNSEDWGQPADSQSEEGIIELTETETFIMERIVQGITYDKIASEINVSRRSIDNYLRKIYVKLEVSSRAQAIERYALHARQSKTVS
ncbi:NarL family two-component system response regulator YdfI [Paenibacillus intestini]|uniref:Response regulator transcription factor n=1 Tax=Paenibacillus cucumis (ex Kampfer et al. 2016) TaxID=1776858 RepID=A0ABS7KC00_9BACL|nr:response regulator transcription factor [Paenibacillus cucumis (ex Kampfer et al. 2016)]MBY0201667.1 response regulator transcription factor [Paenibacillus cucumis (ex Kampfer et al. 2016)]MDP9698923.1 NarL family two-component system response regulator YdfI [Paenibacillus intestini]